MSISHVAHRMSHVAHIRCVMLQIWMSHVAHVNEPLCTKWNESRHTHIKGELSHSAVAGGTLTHMKESNISHIRQIPLKMIQPRNPTNPETQIPRYKFKSESPFVLRDTEKCEFLDLVGFGGVAISVETVR